MNIDLMRALALCETDVDGTIRRFSGNEELYLSCLAGFLDDPTITELNDAVGAGSWDDAFTAAHALKGLAGNMGFIPLYHATGELVVAIRAGRMTEIGATHERLNRCYKDITTAIRNNLGHTI